MTANKPSTRPEKLKALNPSVDWASRQNSFVRRLLNALERVSLTLEAPIARLIRDPRLNPLYHTGTITVVLFILILITGVYLTMFYQFGFTASYEAIVGLNGHVFNRWMRTIHRYASGAAILTSLLHGWRTFFQDRFRGARWTAWVTGVVMTVIFWLIGITGYWLLWDERAQVLNQTLIQLIGKTPWGSAFLLKFLITDAAGSGWIFLLLVLTAHLLLSVVVGLFFWWHIQRLSRPKWLPARDWTTATTVLILLASLIVPAGILPSINPGQLPANIPIDPLFLFYLPGALIESPALFWGLVIALVAFVSLLPWLLARKPLAPVQVDLGLCDGCILCSRDCPYNAITMVPRTDGARPKFQAEINPALCVSCGICVGSCPENALTLGDIPIAPLWDTTTRRAASADTNTHLPTKVVFTCERHIQHHQKALSNPTALDADFNIQIVPLTCVGMLNPNLITETLESGADFAQVVGCPPEDCSNREGNLWLQQRLDRERLPRLKVEYQDAPIQTTWTAPTNFMAAVRGYTQSAATAYQQSFSRNMLSSFGPALVLAAIVVGIQVGTNKLNYAPFSDDQAMLEIALTHHSGYPLEELPKSQDYAEAGLDLPTRLVVEVDQSIVLDQTYPLRGSDWERASLAFEQIPITTGEHHIRLLMYDRADPFLSQILFDKSITLNSRQTLTLSYHDASLGNDPAAGRKLYYETSLGTNAGCRICHSLEEGVTLVGPSFAGIATRAAERVPGMSAEEYLRQSILDPEAYVVEGFPTGQMLPNLGDILSAQQIDDLIAFLMTFE